MKKLIILIPAIFIIGCQKMPEPKCTGTAIIGGQETTVQIYDTRKQANQTQYYAGNPFGWKWVSKNNFIITTCER